MIINESISVDLVDILCTYKVGEKPVLSTGLESERVALTSIRCADFLCGGIYSLNFELAEVTYSRTRADLLPFGEKASFQQEWCATTVTKYYNRVSEVTSRQDLLYKLAFILAKTWWLFRPMISNQWLKPFYFPSATPGQEIHGRVADTGRRTLRLGARSPLPARQ